MFGSQPCISVSKSTPLAVTGPQRQLTSNEWSPTVYGLKCVVTTILIILTLHMDFQIAGVTIELTEQFISIRDK